jgi:hypothetical protein
MHPRSVFVRFGSVFGFDRSPEHRQLGLVGPGRIWVIGGWDCFDSGYLSADLVTATVRSGITMITPLLADQSRQACEQAGFERAAFTVNWTARQVKRPAGNTSARPNPVRQHGRDATVVTFPAASAVRAVCVRSEPALACPCRLSSTRAYCPETRKRLPVWEGRGSWRTSIPGSEAIIGVSSCPASTASSGRVAARRATALDAATSDLHRRIVVEELAGMLMAAAAGKVMVIFWTDDRQRPIVTEYHLATQKTAPKPGGLRAETYRAPGS